MISVGKCPKCDSLVGNSTTVERMVFGNQAFGPLFSGISVICSKCKTVLGISNDPDSMKKQIVAEVLNGLGVKRKR